MSTIILLVLILLAFHVRLMHFLYAPDLPYGMGDAAFHYQIGLRLFRGEPLDYVWNGLLYNEFQGRFFFPPLAYYIPAYAAKLTGEFQHTVYPVNALISSLAVLTTFLLVRELLGEHPALAASLFMALNIRDIESLMWGQWPAVYSLSLTPLIIYAGLKSVRQPHYLYISAFSTGLCVLTYPQTAVYAFACVAAVALMHRRNLQWRWSHVAASLAILLLVSSPVLLDWSRLSGKAAGEGGRVKDVLWSLLSWYPKDYENPIYPPEWYNPLQRYTLFGLPLIAAGFILLFLNRDSKAGKTPFLLFLAMAVLFYLAVHLTQILVSLPRALKYILLEPYVLSIAFAAPFSPKLVDDRRLRIAALALLLLFTLNFLPMMFPSDRQLALPGMRVTPKQLEALEWLRSNTGERSIVIYQGYRPMMLGWGTVLSGRRLVKPEGDGYYFQGVPVWLEGEAYALIDFNKPSQQPPPPEQTPDRLAAVDKSLENISAVAFRNEEIIIRRLLPSG